MTEMECCTKCRSDKPISEFGRAARDPSRKQTVCKRCVQDRQTDWGNRNAKRNLRNIVEGARACVVCRVEKPASEFGRRSKTKSGVSSTCNECWRIRDKKRYADDPERRKETAKWAALKWNFGISREEWEAILLRQDKKCAICLGDLAINEKRSAMSPCVDHDHDSGKVRGILCRFCNQGIGLLKDSSAVANQAADYLRRHGK